jgi:hypothetical protein
MNLTPEQVAYLTERGFNNNPLEGEDWRKWIGPWLHSLEPFYAPKPPHQLLGWVALATDLTGNVEFVVRQAELCTDPVTCYVTATIRGWRRE